MSIEDVANRLFKNFDLEQLAQSAILKEMTREHEEAEGMLKTMIIELEGYRQRIKLLGEEDLDVNERQRFEILPNTILELDAQVRRLEDRMQRIQAS